MEQVDNGDEKSDERLRLMTIVLVGSKYSGLEMTVAARNLTASVYVYVVLNVLASKHSCSQHSQVLCNVIIYYYVNLLSTNLLSIFYNSNITLC